MLTSYFDRYARDYIYYKDGNWCYEDGCLYRGLVALHQATGDQRWFDHLLRLVDGQVDGNGTIRGYAPDEYNIDNILPGRALVYLYGRTGDKRFVAALETLTAQLDTHPRIAAGCHWHKLRYPHQVWLDGLYMALPFKAEVGSLLNRPSLVEEASAEALTALDLTFDPATGLYRHGYDEKRLQGWADPVTGLSPSHWARAIGWMCMALVDLADTLPPQAADGELSQRLSDLLQRLVHLRTSDGRWLQVIDRPDLAGNYAESSATAMFAYVFQKAERLGIAESLGHIGREALDALASLALKPARGERLVLTDICCVAGLGGFGDRYRDGSAEYYLSEELKDDDIKGVAPLMMAFAEAIRSGHRIPDEVVAVS